jgi:hypothetical protein
MIGGRYNNMYIPKKHNQREQGQILLITVMLLAAAVTVVMTIAFNSTTETQITKLEEDSQKALSAAESALEAAIQKKGTVAIDELPAFIGSNITGQADVVEMSGNEFVTPLLQRDEQYTFYLSSYNPDTNTFSNPWTGYLDIYFKSETPAEYPALELTFIDSANNTTKQILDHWALVESKSPSNELPTSSNDGGETVKGIAFAAKLTPSSLQVAGNMKAVIVRVLNASTRIGFHTGVSTPFRSQGRVITSEAKTSTGVTKKIELFQSNPQIPSDFFVTAF